MKLREKREKLRAEAIERQAAYDKLSVKQRIALAMSRRGESKKEIKRLRKQLEESKNATSSK